MFVLVVLKCQSNIVHMNVFQKQFERLVTKKSDDSI